MKQQLIIELEKAKAMKSIVAKALSYSCLPSDLVDDFLKLNEQYDADIKYYFNHINYLEEVELKALLRK